MTGFTQASGTLTIDPATTFAMTNQNGFDYQGGSVLGTVWMRAKAAAEDTVIAFNATPPRKTDAAYQGNSVFDHADADAAVAVSNPQAAPVGESFQ